MSTRAVSAIAAVCGLVALAGCGSDTATVKPAGAARSVTRVVASQTGFRPTDVSCPSGVEAKVGVRFDCTFTGPEPQPYVAHVRITKVSGKDVVFFIRSRPSGG